MLSFGRLGKNNRSQQALSEQLSAGGTSGSGSGSGSGAVGSPPPPPPHGAGSSSQISLLSALALPARANSPAEAITPPQSASSSTTAPGASEGKQGQQGQLLQHLRHQQLPHQRLPHQQQQQQHHHPHPPHHHLLLDQQQQQRRRQTPPPPPPHLFTQSGGANSPIALPPSSPGSSPFLDGHQPPTPLGFGPAVRRSQSQSQSLSQSQNQSQNESQNRSQNLTLSQRYRARLGSDQQQPSQHQPVYGIASGSIDDLSGTAPHQQHQHQHQPSSPASAPPKRLTRKLIKGIFGSSRDAHDSQQQQQPSPHSAGHSPVGPHDNPAGLSRGSSTRVSNPPTPKTNLPQSKRFPSDRDWLSQLEGAVSQQSWPLHEAGAADDHSSHLKDSGILVYQNTNPRQVSRENLDLSPYDQVYEPPDHPPPHHQQQQQQQQQQPQPQPLQRRGTIRVQEQQAKFELLPKQTRLQQQQYQHQQQSPQEQAAHHDQGPGQQPQHPSHYPANSPQSPYQPSGEPRIATSQLETNQQLQNAETISQLSHDSLLTDSDSPSAFSIRQLQQTPSTPHGSTPSRNASVVCQPDQGASLQGPDYTEMVPPAPGSGPQSSRRVQDADKGLRGQVDAPLGPPPGYHRQGSVPLNAMSPAPPPGQGALNPSSSGAGVSQYIDASPGVDQGRKSPQPSSDRDAELEKQFKDLLTKYKNVKRLYFDGKSQIEQLNGQVEHLQNAVANQRMSQSRTAWDDSEYSTRFNRLNGAIINLSFNIRKDWRSLPTWVDNFVSADALKTGKQEMTAVGRAVVSRWLVDEVFNRCFHPALDEPLSAQLKEIEMSIRGNSYTMHSQEEFDALTSKVINWRMVTLDGLQKKLGSAQATENRAMLTNKITSHLTTYLYQFLSTPPPPGVEGSTSVIAELAVAIAANLPLESRDVAIMYPLPGDAVQTSIMEVEKTGLPPLEGHKEHDGDSNLDDDPGERDKNGLSRDADKVRFAGFVALEVRGRQVLAKAPVWTLCS
ncbi:hypothetical protein E4U42_001236 [Claviceps africana]|uniref:S-adenosylmethionine-dependent methyltransferase-like protein n=1 Tax=Claviceps africana TaxID=83212 RepID=A0A8K0NMY8_9HYPO|nr:hypothetical protein E4U42_001236 [Claviceps africana]